MSIADRIRSWFDRRPRPADPADLHPGTETPGGGASTTGLDRPFPEAGPVAEPPVADPRPADPNERPLG